jgi:hypothetical protein
LHPCGQQRRKPSEKRTNNNTNECPRLLAHSQIIVHVDLDALGTQCEASDLRSGDATKNHPRGESIVCSKCACRACRRGRSTYGVPSLRAIGRQQGNCHGYGNGHGNGNGYGNAR